jgi:undecaprenyl pyrophosphate phosphatase UppP
MAQRQRKRFYVETVIAGVAGVMGIVTVFWHDWIEALTGWDPDHHNGSAEWFIIVGLLLIAAVLGIAARVEWRRARLASPPLAAGTSS